MSRLSLGAAALLLGLAAVLQLASAVQFTGDAALDFGSATGEKFAVVRVGNSSRVGGATIPPVIANGRAIVSGWNILNIYFQYEATEDLLHVGIECAGVCGDADGLLGPDAASPELLAALGADEVDLGGTESYAIAFDLDNNTANEPELIFGKPASAPGLDCGAAVLNGTVPSLTNCLGAWVFNKGQPATTPLSFRFGQRLDIVVENRNPTLSAQSPSIEFTVRGFGALRVATLGLTSTLSAEALAAQPFTLGVSAFGGSYSDASIGEDNLPARGAAPLLASFPCARFDACGKCGGDDSSCADCAGVPKGQSTYDLCDVCGGDSSTCSDCLGIPNGKAVYDNCDVCGGSGVGCDLDCKGVLGGSAKYDVCDVCDGRGLTCLDCRGQANGPHIRDACGVCDGDGSTCVLDCAGVAGGLSKYDVCDVCRGDGTTCRDCKGVSNGPARFDKCGVCGGNNQKCADCAGIPNGPATYDVCGVCNGYGTTCSDCLGTPNGGAYYDRCDVCNGDDSTCLDCKGIPYGPYERDECGVCGGDGTSCIDCAGVTHGTSVYDSCGICGGDGSSCTDCAGVPFGKHILNECGKCVERPTPCFNYPKTA